MYFMFFMFFCMRTYFSQCHTWPSTLKIKLAGLSYYRTQSRVGPQLESEEKNTIKKQKEWALNSANMEISIGKASEKV